MSYYIIKYEFMGQDSAGLRGGEVQFQVIKFFEPLYIVGVRPGIFTGTAPIAISIETPLNRPFPGTKLDVP